MVKNKKNNKNNKNNLMAPTPKPRKMRPNKRPRTRIRANIPMPLKDYLVCRLDPFNSMGSTGIPDASGGKRIVVDHRNFYDVIISSSGGLNMLLVASPSTPLLVKDIADSTTGGSVTSGGISTTLTNTRATINGNYVGLPNLDWKPYVTTSPISQAYNPYGAQKFRVVTCACRVTYTGTVLNGAGMISVFPNTLDTEETPIPNQYSVASFAATGAASTVYPVGELLVNVIDTTTPSVPIPGTVSQRAVNPVQITCSRVTPNSRFQSIPNQPVSYTTPVSSDPSGTNTNNPLLAVLSSGNAAHIGMMPIDTQFTAPYINVRGMLAGTSLRIETVVCVEYMLESKSPFSPLAHDIPSTNDNLLAFVDKKIADAPVAAPPGRYKALAAKLLSQAGTVATAFGGPAIGGAVGVLSNAISDLVISN